MITPVKQCRPVRCFHSLCDITNSGFPELLNVEQAKVVKDGFFSSSEFSGWLEPHVGKVSVLLRDTLKSATSIKVMSQSRRAAGSVRFPPIFPSHTHHPNTCFASSEPRLSGLGPVGSLLCNKLGLRTRRPTFCQSSQGF